jgi:hypothetical protein
MSDKNFKPFRPKGKNIFERKNDQLDDIYNYQNEGINPNDAAKDEFPSIQKKKKGKLFGLFGKSS